MKNEWGKLKIDILCVIDSLLTNPKPLKQQVIRQPIQFDSKPCRVPILPKLHQLWTLRNNFTNCKKAEDFLLIVNELDTFIGSLNEGTRKAYAAEMKDLTRILARPDKWPPELWQRWSTMLSEKYPDTDTDTDTDESGLEEAPGNGNPVIFHPSIHQPPSQQPSYAGVRFTYQLSLSDLRKSDDDRYTFSAR